MRLADPITPQPWPIWKRNKHMKRFAHIAITGTLSLAVFSAFAADPVAGTTTTGTTATTTGTTTTSSTTTTGSTTTATGTVTATTTTRQPIAQGLSSVRKNLERDPDNKGLQNAEQRLTANMARQELHRTEREQRVETAKAERIERVARVERVERMERPERPGRIERPEGGRGR